MKRTILITGASSVGLIKKLSSAASIVYAQSNIGIELIEGFEGLRLNAYLDTAGVPTIGWGSTRYADGTKVKLGDKLKSRAEADRLFLITLKYFAEQVNKLVTVELTQNQFDALVSLVYNIGVGAFAGSSLLAALNAGRYIIAADKFLDWNKSRFKGVLMINNVLVMRRIKERKLFLKP
jgi:lysozyme